jgi:hypothetical protein
VWQWLFSWWQPGLYQTVIGISSHSTTGDPWRLHTACGSSSSRAIDQGRRCTDGADGELLIHRANVSRAGAALMVAQSSGS